MAPSLINWLWSSSVPESHSPAAQQQRQPQLQPESLASSPPPPPSEKLPPTPPTATAPAPATSTAPALDLAQQAEPKPDVLPRNLKLLLGGAVFVPLTLLLTRRAMHRRFVSTIPPYYTSTTFHRPRVHGAVDGLEAFSLATLNVAAFAMLASGAAAWTLDVNSVEDLRDVMRRVTRKQVGVESGGVDGAAGGERPRTDEEIETDLQEWVAGVLARQFQEETRKEVERRRRERGEVAVDGEGR